MKIAEEVKAKILAEPANMPINPIAKKYGIDWKTVKDIRQAAGLYETNLAKVKKLRQEAKLDKSVLVPASDTCDSGGSIYDKAIEAVEGQVQMFSDALSVLQGLRDLELAERKQESRVS